MSSRAPDKPGAITWGGMSFDAFEIGFDGSHVLEPADEATDRVLGVAQGTYSVDCTLEMSGEGQSALYDQIVAATSAELRQLILGVGDEELPVTSVEQVSDTELVLRATSRMPLGGLTRRALRAIVREAFPDTTSWIRIEHGQIIVHLWLDSARFGLGDFQHAIDRSDDLEEELRLLAPVGIEIGVHWDPSHSAPIGPVLEHCVLHEDCAAAMLKGGAWTEMGLTCPMRGRRQ